MKRDGTASDKRNAANPAAPPPLPQTATPVDEPIAGEPQNTPSSKISTLMTEVLDKENLKRALERVKRNKGAPGIDGMTVDELSAHLKAHWPSIRAQLVAGSYCPQPVRRVEIPKPDGRKRLLGIPTVIDRFIQQALAQVVQRQWEPHFHPNSYGFRPGRNAHQAMRHAQATIRQGYGWVVDIDLEAFFDRPNSTISPRPPDGSRASARGCTRCAQAHQPLSQRRGAGQSVKSRRQQKGCRKAAPCRRCWPTWCWTNWTGRWSAEVTALPAMLMIAIYLSKANARASGSCKT